MQQFANMDNFMEQINQMPQFDQAQQYQQQMTQNPGQQQYYPNEQDEDQENEEYYEDDYEYGQEQQGFNPDMIDMLTPEQQEQFQYFQMLQQQGGLPNQMGNMNQFPGMNQIDYMGQMNQMSQMNQVNQIQEAPIAQLNSEQFPSLQASTTSTSTTSTGTKKKKMRLNVNASAFNPGATTTTTSNIYVPAVQEKDESLGEWDRPLERQISPQQQFQQQMLMNQWGMGMQPMMGGMGMQPMMGGMGMQPMMGGMGMQPMMGGMGMQPIMGGMGMQPIMGGMGMPQMMGGIGGFPMFAPQISSENQRLFSSIMNKTTPIFGMTNKQKKAAGGIVSFGGDYSGYSGVEKPKKKKKKEIQPQSLEPKKQKVFKKRVEDQQKVVVKKQMVKEDELFKMQSGFDYSNGLLHQVDESRQPLNIVFIGHVDAGKSTICGNILVKAGKVDPLELKKFEAEAKSLGRDTWFLAYIMDISIEERQKGKTVEVGKATFETPSKRFTLLDAPGHKNYVPNMLAGASQSDVACLVVSAKTGEFESGFEKDGQTREHAMLVRSLGCQYMIVVVNKMDECEWDVERYNYIKEQLSPFLEKTCGLNLEKEVAWCPISGITGENIKEKNQENSKSDWFTGLTLFEMLDSVPLPERNTNGDLRIPVLDSLKDMGLYVFGKIESGIIVQGQQVTMMPFQTVFTVQHIFNADDQCVPYGKPGENVKLKVKDIEEEDIKRGFVICNNEDFCQYCYELEAELQILELPDHKQIISAGYACIIHLHTIMEEVQISHIIARKSTGESIATTFLKSGMTGIVRIQSKSYLCVEKFSKEIHLGSFTLRDEGRTIALGKILRVKPAKKLPQLNKPETKE